MIVEQIERKVEKAGERKTRTVQAQIVACSRTFRDVTLYTHPIHAICRELGQNAADAHVMAGKADKPFEVTMPHALSPSLRIRDFGTGVTVDGMEKHVINVGDTSKIGEDGQTGGFGRGLYAILGYTDLFTFRSFVDGRVYNHSCEIGDSGMPEWNLDDEGQVTTEPNGVEVQIPVLSKDFEEFRNEAMNVYRWFGHPKSNFKCQPILKGVQIPEINATLQSEDYLLCKDISSAVVMGNVRYPLDLSYNLRRSLNDIEREIISEGVILYMPLAVERDGKQIQPVTPVAQRDGLSYDEKTLQSIKEAIEVVASKLLEDAIEKVKAAETQLDARRMYEELFGCVRSTLLGRILNEKNGRVIWKGRDVSRPIQTYKQIARKKKGLPTTYVTLQHVRAERWVNNSGNRVSSKEFSYLPNDVTKIIVRDVDKGFIRKMRHHVLEGDAKQYWTLSTVPGGDLERWIEKYGLEDLVVKASSLPDPPKVERVRSQSTKKTVKELRYNFYARYSKYAWDDTEIDLSEGGVYVEVHRYSWRNKGELGYHDWRRLLKYRDILGDTPLYGLRKGPAEKLAEDKEASKKWMSLQDFFEKRLREIVKGRKYSLQIDAAEAAAAVLSSDCIKLDEHKFARGSLFAKALKACNRIAEMPPEHRRAAATFRECSKRFGYEMEKLGLINKAPEHPLKQLCKKVRETYPMVDLCSRWLRDDQIKPFVDYIRLVDSNASK